MPDTPTSPIPSPTDVVKSTPQSPTQVIGAPAKPAPVTRRRFGDSETIKNLIYDNVLKEASNIPPIANSRYQLSLHDLHYADPAHYSKQDQKEAILGNKTLSRRLRGTWRLSDVKTGDTIDQRTMTIAQVPHMNNRGTFILNGSDYSLAAQMRLLPGIYTHFKANGEVEAHVNVIPGKGVSHRYFFEPETGMFKINIGQSKVPLMPLLRAMGVSDSQLRNAWGPDLYNINKREDSPHIIDKLYQRIVRRGDKDAAPETKAQALTNELNKMEFDPEVTSRTLGHPYKNLTADAILATTKKLVAVNKREVDPDDRDHLAYQRLMGPEDLIPERITKDQATLRKLLWHTTSKGNLDYIQPGAFTKSVMAAFLSSGLGQAGEEVNAAELVDQQGRITRLGEGGIGSAQVVPEESRAVHASQLGYIDPVKSPESCCHDPAKPQYFLTKQGWKLCPDITPDDEFACLVDGRLEYHKPLKMHVVDYDGPAYCAETRSIGYMLTPNHRMWVQPFHSPKAKWRFELAEETHDRYMKFQIGGHKPFVGANENQKEFKLPGIANEYQVNVHDLNQYEDINLDIGDWAELLGWYISEGSLLVAKAKEGFEHYRAIQISQSKKANPDCYARIEALLKRLPFKYGILKNEEGFHVNDVRLAIWLHKLGRYCFEKVLPEEAFDYPVAARQRLMESMLLGDGRTGRKGRIESYSTTSEKLAHQFRRLSFDLGHSNRISIEKEKRLRKDGTPNYDNYVVTLHKEIHRTIEDNHHAARHKQPTRYSIKQFKGKVYCVTLPGGMIYTKLCDKSGLWSGNSFKAGVDLRTAYGVQKGSDGKIYAPFFDPKTGRYRYLNPQQISTSVVAFPGEFESGNPYVKVVDKGQLRIVPRTRVNLIMPAMENSFSPLSNMVPMKSMTKGQRVSMGARMTSQALPLIQAEAPFVQSKVPGLAGGADVSFEELYGQYMGPVIADKGGTVVSVSPTEVKVKHDDGKVKSYELYNNMPYNRKCVIGSTQLSIKKADNSTWTGPIKDYQFTEGDQVLSINPDTYKAEFFPVAQFHVIPRVRKKLYKVTTRSGRSVVLTEDHALLTTDDSGKLTTIYPDICTPFVTKLPVINKPGYTEHDKDLEKAANLEPYYYDLVPINNKGKFLLEYRKSGAGTPGYLMMMQPLVTIPKSKIKHLVYYHGKWANSEVSWDLITAVTRYRTSEKFVYDLTVDKSHVFALRNGLFVHNTYLHNIPLVKPGDRINDGEVLAKSNYTDENGRAALGVNARIAYLPFRGKTYEDACVISESMAKRLTSEHMYQHNADFGPEIYKGKKAFISLFPNEYSKEILDRMDDNGIVKPGTVVNYGDPLILMGKEKERAHNQVHRSSKGGQSNVTVTWDHHAPGQITDVVHTKGGAMVAVKSYVPSIVGDKVSNRFGSKSIIADIVPDEQMPHSEDGRPYEMLVSPLGIISRINPSQIVEVALGKIAEKTGKPYKIEDFDPRINLTQYAMNELKKHNMSDLETITDPQTGRKIPNVFAGNSFIMKLHHQAECFDDQTEVLTNRGWLNWDKVKPTDRLATVDNGKLLFEKPLALVKQHHDGVLYCFSASYIDYAVTSNHRMYASYYYSKDRSFQFKTAEALHNRRFRVPQFGFPQVATNKAKTIDIGDKQIPYSDYAALVGWWASEGSIGKGRVTIYQSRAANPTKFQDIQNLLSRLPFRFNIHKAYGEDMGLVIYDKDLAQHLKLYGTHSHNKRLPRHLLEQKPSILKYTFDAMMAGDGDTQVITSHYNTHDGPKSCQTDKARYTTVSKGLADDFQELCIRMGLGAIVSKAKLRPVQQFTKRDGSKHICKCRQAYVCGVALKRKNAMVDGDRNRQSFSIKSYKGYVYCAEMRTGLIYVRRNGKPILTGNSKLQGRGVGGGYSTSGEPAKGGETGSKRVSLADTQALLSHGATGALRDAHIFRGQQDVNYWLQFEAGHMPPDPKIPFMYEKFINELRGSGINVVRDGTKTQIMALTNKDIENLTKGREIQNAETVDWKEGLKPIKGGLFDPGITGSHGGTQWSRITLFEPLPNPTMEEPIRRLLGLTEAKFLDVIAGKEPIDGITGPKAIQHALSKIDLDKEIKRAQAEIDSGRKSYRDAAVRRLLYLTSAKKLNIHPKDWILDSVPVLPPAFRPVSLMQGKRGQIVSDPNYLYREVWEANKILKDLHGQIDDLSEERLNLYNAFKGVTGLGDPIQPKNQERQVKGILKHIFGAGPKFSTVQFKLLGASVNLVGRGVVTPNPEMDMDHIGLPEAKIWEVYKPFIIRGLVRSGMPRLRALQEVEDKGKAAKDILLKTMSERPVLVNRYPVLHRYGLMAFWPKLVKGHTIQVSPIITKQMGMDFDGDCKSLEGKDMWLLEDKLRYGKLKDLVKELDPSWPPSDSRIADLEPGKLKVCSFKDGRPVFLPVSQIHFHTKHKALRRIILRSRQTLTVTNDHSLMMLDENFELVQVSPDDIKTETALPIAAHLPVPVLYESIDIGKRKVPLTREFGYIMGHFIGDQEPYPGDAAKYMAKEYAHISVIRDQLKACGLRYRKTTAYEYDGYIVQGEVGRWLKSTLENVYFDKLMPNWVFATPREFREGLVDGILSMMAKVHLRSYSYKSDKSIKSYSGTLTIESTNLALLEDITTLLRTLGIFSEQSKPYDNGYSILEVNVKDYKGYRLTHPIRMSELENTWARVENAREQAGGGVARVYPWNKKFAKKLRAIIKARGDKTGLKCLTNIKLPSVLNYLSPHVAVNLIENLNLREVAKDEPLVRRWLEWVDNKNLHWIPIYENRQVPFEEVTFDVTVPGPHLTVDPVSGIITHQTAQFHVPASEAAVQDAATKMLPSANLFGGSTFKVHYLPNQEFIQGLHAASTAKEGDTPKRIFATRKDAIAAYKRGEINLGTPIEVLDHRA